MANNYEDIMKTLQEVAQDYSLLKTDNDIIDNMLLEVIKIERRHLYGLETTSISKRRSEIEKYLDNSFNRYREGKNNEIETN